MALGLLERIEPCRQQRTEAGGHLEGVEVSPQHEPSILFGEHPAAGESPNRLHGKQRNPLRAIDHLSTNTRGKLIDEHVEQLSHRVVAQGLEPQQRGTPARRRPALGPGDEIGAP